jgi:transposase
MDTTLTGRRRNRSWPEALKQEIVAASFAPGASVSVVARRYQVNANQVFSWRKLYRDGLLASTGPKSPQLVPVIVHTEQREDPGPISGVMDMIEIDLTGKYRIRVGGGFDAQALRRVLDVLEQR